LALWAGLAAVGVVLVDAVAVVAVVVALAAVPAGALALLVELEDADPQALTNSARRTAAVGMRIGFTSVSLTPPSYWLASRGRRPVAVASRELRRI
jgi:hypothetical protein